MNISLPHPDYRWQELSKPAAIGWTFVLLVLTWQFRPGHPTLLDNMHLVTHEAGHLLFGYLGNETLMIAGGTLLQLMVPAALALSFAWRGHTTGTAFCAWAFCSGFEGIGTYMADARAKGLPLVSPGVASDEIEEHDWEYLFNQLGVIKHDVQIGHATQWLGVLGMLAVIAWLVWMWRRAEDGTLNAA